MTRPKESTCPGASRERNRLRASILRWYDREKRDLPWRRTRDPYAIWVSEIMLQQTRVEAVIPYYDRFLTRFPDVAALARARESDVLAAWSGLGYYRRARSLRAGAQFLVREHAATLPDDPVALRAVPGIGAYTAGAIASVAFDRPAAAVDGNVIRVLARIEGLHGRRDDAKLRAAVTRSAEALAAGPRPRDWTQALMELGAMICLPRAPLCDRCPARSLCAAYRSGAPDAYPVAARKAPVKPVRRVLLLARSASRLLLTRALSKPSGARGGRAPAAAGPTAWTLPTAEASKNPAAAARRLARDLGLPDEAVRGPVARFRHITFAEHVSFEVWETTSTRQPRKIPGGRWVFAHSIEELPVRAPTLKAIRKLQRADGAPKRRGTC